MAIRFQGNTSTNATSTALSPHRSGDLILVFAYRSTSNAAITVPAASGTIPTWITLGTSSANATSSVLAYTFARRSGHTSGTWTNATHLSTTIIRGIASIGQVAGNTGSSSTINYPTLTPQNPNGTSVIMAQAAHNVGSSTSGIDNPPLMMHRYFAGFTSPRLVLHYSGQVFNFPRGLTSFSSANVNHAFIGAWTSWVFEAKPRRTSVIS